MNHLMLRSLLAATLLIGSTNVDAAIDEVFVVMSPFYSDDFEAALRPRLDQLILLDAPLGTRITFVDGWNSTTIASLDLPDLTVDTPRARGRSIKAEYRQLIVWLNSPPVQQGSNGADLSGTASVDVPSALDYCATHRDGAATVAIIGSPVYEADPDWTFIQRHDDSGDIYRFPSDGALLTTRLESPFSLQFRRQQLSHVDVRWVLPQVRQFPNDAVARCVQDFWRVFVGEQNGTVSAYTTDSAEIGTLFDRREPLPRLAIDPDARPGSIMIAPDRSPAATLRVPVSKLPQREVRIAAPAEEDATAKLEEAIIDDEWVIGIAWDAPADVDLWVWSRDPREVPLFFQNQGNSAGIYVEDLRTATRGAYERVILNQEPGEVWINLWGGAGPISGTVIYKKGATTRSGTFQLDVASGNRAHDVNGRAESRHWTRIELENMQ